MVESKRKSVAQLEAEIAILEQARIMQGLVVAFCVLLALCLGYALHFVH